MNEPSLRAKTLQRLQALGLQPKRSLGQNFLISESVVQRIVDEVKRVSRTTTTVLEIGPGLGALTDHLREISGQLFLLEMDHQFSEHWRKEGLSVHEGDALKVDWSLLGLPDSVTLVSNLPYQIAASLVIETSTRYQFVHEMILMFQKEVAQRITAEPGSKDYGLLSVVAQAFWQVHKVCEAGPGDLYPAPKVASRVLSFHRKLEVPDASFVGFVKQAFAQRRKMLVKNLSSWANSHGHSKELLIESLVELGHTEKVRGEQLSVDQFKVLFNKLRQVNSNGN